MFPRMIKIKQNMPVQTVEDVVGAVLKSLDSIKARQINLEGKTIGITAGSRGINNISLILKTIADYVKEAKGNPVLIPSMGSHGGGALEGQREVLASLGITEEAVGAPVRCCIDTVMLGETPSGVPVYCNKEAVKMDGLIVVNRIKSHTDFSGKIESGICKMLAIGLGSEKGAITTHSHAIVKGYEEVITEVAKVMISKLPVLFAVGILENWKSETAEIGAFLPEEIVEKEKLMLAKYKESAIKLPFTDLDVLAVGKIGKNISGTGMDTKVIGRIHIKGQKEPDKPKIARIVVLGLTEESHGNAVGIGLADITTQEVFESIDLRRTGFNCISSMAPEQGFIPCVAADDRAALESALATLGAVEFSKIRMVYIKNTSSLEEMAVSEALIGEVQSDSRLDIIGELEELQFDASGKLLNFRW